KGDYWAAQYAGSITLGAGQFCTNPGLILGIKGKPLDNFVTKLGEEIIKIAPSAMLHPNIHKGYEQGKKELSSQSETAIVASYDGDSPSNYGKQKVLTVSGSDFLKNTVLHREVFGPFSLVVQCKDDKELEKILSHLEGQLTGTVLGNAEELGKYSTVVDALKS